MKEDTGGGLQDGDQGFQFGAGGGDDVIGEPAMFTEELLAEEVVFPHEEGAIEGGGEFKVLPTGGLGGRSMEPENLVEDAPVHNADAGGGEGWHQRFDAGITGILHDAEVRIGVIQKDAGNSYSLAGEEAGVGGVEGVFRAFGAVADEDGAAVAGDVAVFASRNGSVICRSRDNGRALWTVKTNGGVDSSPVVVGRRVFFGTLDGSLYGLELASGKQAWRFRTGAGVKSSPAVAGGRMVIGADDGAIYCFGQ